MLPLKSETKLKVPIFKVDRRMGRTSSNWFRVIRRKFVKSSASRDIIVVHSNTNTNTSSNSREETIATQEEETAILLNDIARASITLIRSKILTKEDIAATVIQAHFRRHLARRAFRALRSLVRLQAMVRGARVRKQARIALHCMHALVRLQVSVCTRQLLGGGDGDDRSTSLRARLC